MQAIINELLNIAKQYAPDSPVIEAGEAIVKTIADPSTNNFVSDIKLAIELAEKLREELKDAHPSILKVLKALL